MNKIRFANDVEMEISAISQSGTTLSIEVETSDVNAMIEAFKDNPDQTSVMRYYVGTDLLRGYAGFTELAGIQYTPDVVKSIDYTTTDASTESGFVEETVDKVIVTMEKPDAVAVLQADVATINEVMEGE